MKNPLIQGGNPDFKNKPQILVVFTTINQEWMEVRIFLFWVCVNYLYLEETPLNGLNYTTLDGK